MDINQQVLKANAFSIALATHFTLEIGRKLLKSFRVSSGMVAQKNRKIGNFVLRNRRKIGKSIVLLLTKTDSLHPHQGYNKSYKTSASTFAGFKSTFTGKN